VGHRRGAAAGRRPARARWMLLHCCLCCGLASGLLHGLACSGRCPHHRSPASAWSPVLVTLHCPQQVLRRRIHAYARTCERHASWTVMGMPWQQAIRGAGGVLLQREVPEAVNLRVAEVAHAAGVPARPCSRTCAVACGFTYVPLDRNWWQRRPGSRRAARAGSARPARAHMLCMCEITVDVSDYYTHTCSLQGSAAVALTPCLPTCVT